MKPRVIKTLKNAAAVAASATLALSVTGCRNGPAVAFSLDLQQGPRLQVGFSAIPATNAPPTPAGATR